MVSRKLAGLNGRRVVTTLQNGGFVLVRVTGSHHMLHKPGMQPRKVVVPVHGAKDLPTGTVRSIIRQSGLTTDEFTKLL